MVKAYVRSDDNNYSLMWQSSYSYPNNTWHRAQTNIRLANKDSIVISVSTTEYQVTSKSSHEEEMSYVTGGQEYRLTHRDH